MKDFLANKQNHIRIKVYNTNKILPPYNNKLPT